MTKNRSKRVWAAALVLPLILCACAARPAEPSNLDPGVRAVSQSAASPGPQPMALGQMPLKPVEQLVTQTAAGSLGDIPLAIPGTFAVTRPTQALVTTYDKYFIMGTSNPSQPVYFGDAEIERLGGGGTFGVHVPLALGKNTFVLRQGGDSQTVTITRNPPPETAKLTAITQSSMTPPSIAGAQAGGTLELTCTAPSGANVTASFGGETAALRQTADALPGIPAVFKGNIAVGTNYPDGETVNAGKIGYTLEYGGATSSYTSTGDVFVAGKNARVTVRVETYLGFIYPDTSDVSVFREKLKRGAIDTVASQNNTYWELSSGGWINKEQTSVVTGAAKVENKLGKVTTAANNREENYIFTGTNMPAYLTEIRGGAFFVTFFNTQGTPRANVAASRLFSACNATEQGGAVTYEFTLRDPDRLWGCNIAYEEGDTVLTFRYKPALKTGDKPMEGVTILLDPGHGGTDPGALGMAGLTGPAEREVNLAHAYAARDALAAMGANVILAREGDATVSLDERLELIEKTRADLFISLHHNSLGENTDGNKVQGIEVYYHTSFSQKTAETVMQGLINRLNRNNRFVEQSYYRVTLSSYAPSILVELGYLCNPLEYERAANPAEIQKAGAAVAAAVKELLAAQAA